MDRKPKPTDRQPGARRGSSSRQIVTVRPSERWAGVTYQLVYKVYRNANASLHGAAAGERLSKNPYWYAYWHDAQTGKTRSKYIGRQFRELTEDEF